MTLSRARHIALVLVLLLAALGAWMFTRSKASVALPVTPVLTVDTGSLGAQFQAGAVGLSTETIEFSRGHLTAGHPALIRLMRLLGPSVLRIGGSSVDLSWWTSNGEAAPQWATSTVTPSDLLALHKLLAATGWRVLLGVDLGHFEPARAADEVRYAQEILGTALMGIEIGNEPNSYSDTRNTVVLRPSSYGVSEYTHEVQAYIRAIQAVAPGISISGPAAGGSQWLKAMGATAGMFTELTQHFYPTTVCPSVPASVEPHSTVAALLSPIGLQRENEALAALSSAGAETDRPTRISETNSVSYCSESTAAEPSLASALWALDWALRAASNGVEGVNFYGGFGPCGRASKSQSPICAQYATGGATARPEYYGLLAASRLEGGRFAPTVLKTSTELPNITSWATVSASGVVKIAIDDLALSGPGQRLRISASGYTATAQALTGPSSGSQEGIAFADASVTRSQRWHPRAQPLPLVHGHLRLVVRPASAVIVTMRPAGA